MLLGATAGNAVDGQVLRRKMQILAERCMGAQGSASVPSNELARRLADSLQTATQTVGGRTGRMLAVRDLLFFPVRFVACWMRRTGLQTNIELVLVRLNTVFFSYLVASCLMHHLPFISTE